MILYGDRVRQRTVAGLRAELHARAAAPLDRSGLAALLVAGGELAQGLADRAQARDGADTICPDADAAMRWLRHVARALLRACRGGATAAVPPPPALADGPLTIRTAEGFAFYAVYPEAYAVACRRLERDRPVTVLGLRSIGTALAAVVAAELGAGLPRTLRPVGHPFARRPQATPALRRAILGRPEARFVVVDEGPGASGSSFGGTADWLEAAGIAASRIAFLPSHAGAPGPMATPAHRDRWTRIARPVATLDDLSGPAAWFSDLIGPPLGPVRDLSGGAWAEGRVPVAPAHERRKFLVRTASGDWLLKFAGIGRTGEEKFRLACRLHEAGFSPEAVAFRHGFLLQRWHADAAPLAAPPPLDWLGRYLGLRASLPAEDSDGADSAALHHMARHNSGADLPLVAVTGTRVRIDGRLHAWEWRRLPDGRILKTDALDHHCGHDLIGCQPITWDIAGAIVEFDLADPAAETLRRIVGDATGRPIDPAQIASMLACYCAFQLALWDAPHADRYRARLRRIALRRPPCPP